MTSGIYQKSKINAMPNYKIRRCFTLHYERRENMFFFLFFFCFFFNEYSFSNAWPWKKQTQIRNSFASGYNNVAKDVIIFIVYLSFLANEMLSLSLSLSQSTRTIKAKRFCSDLSLFFFFVLCVPLCCSRHLWFWLMLARWLPYCE